MPARLIETLFVRADRLCLGDVLVEERGTVIEKKTLVESLTLVGDDVNINGDRITTSVGNVLEIDRTVLPTDPSRFQPSRFA